MAKKKKVVASKKKVRRITAKTLAAASAFLKAVADHEADGSSACPVPSIPRLPSAILAPDFHESVPSVERDTCESQKDCGCGPYKVDEDGEFICPA